MTPTPGRIVMFHTLRGDRPAIVTRVWEATGLLNLHVFFDGANDDAGEIYNPHDHHEHWRTSIAEGTEIGQWSWPDRVTPPAAKLNEIERAEAKADKE